MQLSYDYDYVKQHRPLKLKKKIYEFYTAPITKFWADSVSESISARVCYITESIIEPHPLLAAGLRVLPGPVYVHSAGEDGAHTVLARGVLDCLYYHFGL